LPGRSTRLSLTGCLRTSGPYNNRFNCLMVTPGEMVVGYGELPRSERKSQRVFDGRITDSVV
jgi:hypothetical protein